MSVLQLPNLVLEPERPTDGRTVGGRRRGPPKSGALPGEIWVIFQEFVLKFQGNRIEARSTFASRSRWGRGRVSASRGSVGGVAGIPFGKSYWSINQIALTYS